MPDELSERKGPKPLMINLGEKTDVLKGTLIQSLEASELETDQSLKFKNEFVVLVRDQESKKNLPDFLKNAVCMTIKESKGLEFEDVLIYDFFDSSKTHQAWNLLSNIDVIERLMPKKEYDKIKENYDAGIIDTDRVFVNGEPANASGTQYNVKFVVLDNSKNRKDAITYDDVNDELKQFYVAVTRTKNRLLIYDNTKNHNSTVHPRNNLTSIWKSLNFVKMVKKAPHQDTIDTF
jgi:superfamily I DNA/RNA helicase